MHAWASASNAPDLLALMPAAADPVSCARRHCLHCLHCLLPLLLLQFTVERPQRFRRHNLSTYAARNGLLYTLNCQAGEERWAGVAAAFRRAADSFELLDSGAAGARGFPDRL